MNPKPNPLFPGVARSRQRLSTWLLLRLRSALAWLVITQWAHNAISAQIWALVTAATVEAVQPMPQIV